jgi:hypothetical protein
MGAAVVESADNAILTAHDDGFGFQRGDRTPDEITAVGDFAFTADEQPCTPENPFALSFVDFV